MSLESYLPLRRRKTEKKECPLVRSKQQSACSQHWHEHNEDGRPEDLSHTASLVHQSDMDLHRRFPVLMQKTTETQQGV